MKKQDVILLLKSIRDGNNHLIKHYLSEIRKNFKDTASLKIIDDLKQRYENHELKFFEKVTTDIDLNSFIYPKNVEENINFIIEMYKNREILNKKGLAVGSKILFYGPPGTGKTSAGIILGKILEMPVYILSLSNLIDSFLGSTIKNLKEAFGEITMFNGVYIFDDLDSLFLSRTTENDVGEMKRATVISLSYLERLNTTSLIIGTTNHYNILDNALYRRFNIKLEFRNLTDVEYRKLFNILCKKYKIKYPQDVLDRIFLKASKENPSEFTNNVLIEFIKLELNAQKKLKQRSLFHEKI